MSRPSSPKKSESKNSGNAHAPLHSSTDPLTPTDPLISTNQNNNQNIGNNKAAYYNDPAYKKKGNTGEVYQLLLDGSSDSGSGGANYGTDDSPRNHHHHHHHNNDSDGDTILNTATEDTNTEDDDNDDDNINEPSLTSVFFGSIANLCSATLGAGVLALPYAFLSAGLVVGFLLLILSAIATYFSIDLLVKACAHYQIGTYEALVEHTCGRHMRTVTEISIILFSGGCAVAYVIAVGDILEQSHMLLFQSRRYSMALAWLVAMLPLSLLRKMQTLQFASAVGIASIATLIVAALVHLIQDLNTFSDNGGGDDTNGNTTISEIPSYATSRTLLSGNNNASNPLDFLWPAHGILSVVTACPIILFAFSCQVNVCAIYSELPDKICKDNDDDNMETDSENNDTINGISDSENNMNGISSSVRINAAKEVFMRHVTWTAVAICSALYASISVIALTDLGAAVAPNILSSYQIVGILRVACAAMAAAVIMAFPLNIFPARVTLEGIWENSSFCGSKQVSASGISASDNNLTAGLLEVVDYVHPPVQDARAANAKSKSIVVPPANDDHNHHHLETQEMVETSSIMEEDWHPVRHVFLTLLLAGMALALALVVPDISVVFGLLGGTTSSLLGFCVPGMLGLKLSRDTDDPSLRPTSWTLLIGGLVVGVITTGVTIYHQFFGVDPHIPHHHHSSSYHISN